MVLFYHSRADDSELFQKSHFPKQILRLVIVRRRFYFFRPGQFAGQILRFMNERRQALGTYPGLPASVTQRHQRNLVFRPFTVQTLV
jgi:hypothetical protein